MAGTIIKRNVVKREKEKLHPSYGRKYPVDKYPNYGMRGKKSPQLKGENNPSRRPEVIEKIREKAIERNKDKKYREKHKEACKDYYKTHPHHAKGGKKSKEQKAKMGLTRAEWHIKNPEKAILMAKKMSETKRREGTHKGERNGRWRGGISRLPYSFDFDEEKKERIKQRDNHTCQLCGDRILRNSKRKFLTAHHINYDKMDSRDENLITLCNFCNSSVNTSREEWTKHFQNKINDGGVLNG